MYISQEVHVFMKTNTEELVARTLMARLIRLFSTRSRVPNKKKKKNIAADIVFGIISSDFLFYIDKVCCVYSIELPR